MGMRREHGDPVALPGQADVIDVAPLSQQKALIFHPPHSLPDTELDHVRPPLFARDEIVRSNVVESRRPRQRERRRRLGHVEAGGAPRRTRNYRFSHRRMKPSSPCGMKMTMAMKMSPTGMR